LDNLEDLIVSVLEMKYRTGNLGLRSKTIYRYLVNRKDIDWETREVLSPTKVGHVCSGSDRIIKTHENKRGAYWMLE